MTGSSTRARYTVALLLSMPAVVWSIDLLAGTPPLILGAAVVPAALAAAVLLFAQRGSGRRFAPLVLSLAWGAVGAAFLSSNGNELARHWMDAGAQVAPEDARGWTALVVAPALEESAKSLGLVLMLVLARRLLRDARDGIVYGALIGVGFTFTENLLYLGVSMLQGGEAGLARALYLRGGVGAATHVVFTACVGAGLGWWAARKAAPPRFRSAWLVPVLAFVFALAQHFTWNAVAAPRIAIALCGAAVAGGACRSMPTGIALFGETSVIALVLLAPGLWLLAIAWRRPHPVD